MCVRRNLLGYPRIAIVPTGLASLGAAPHPLGDEANRTSRGVFLPTIRKSPKIYTEGGISSPPRKKSMLSCEGR